MENSEVRKGEDCGRRVVSREGERGKEREGDGGVGKSGVKRWCDFFF